MNLQSMFLQDPLHLYKIGRAMHGLVSTTPTKGEDMSKEGRMITHGFFYCKVGEFLVIVK